MAGKGDGGKSPLKMLVSMIVTLFLLGTLMVALVSSGGWAELSKRLDLGDSNASTSELTDPKGSTPANPNAQPLNEWLNTIFGGSSSPTPSPTPVTPNQSTTPNQPSSPESNQQAQSENKTDNQSTPDQSTNKAESNQQAQTGRVFWQQSLNAMNTIQVAKPRQGGYDREQQFGGWAASDCGKASTRDMILARDMSNVVKDKACRVTSGILHDPYTGKTIQFTRGTKTSSLVQIDHVVALQDAWASGARDWSREQRVKYANDPNVLVASDGSANMAKGVGVDFNGTSRWITQHTGTPNVWQPDNTSYRCDYMAKRVAIKHEYKLSMSAKEKQETVTFLAQCVQ